MTAKNKKQAKNHKTPYKEISTEDDYKWRAGVDIDFKSSACTGECSYYCRCGTIISTTISVNKIEFFNSLKKKGFEYPIRDYCLERLVNIIIDKECFNITISKGYYGEEIDAVSLENDTFYKSYNKINSFNFSEAESVELILELEYGYVLPELKNKNWEIKTINIDNITFNKYKHSLLNVIEEYKKQDEFVVLCNGIDGSDNYKLIDGYHRFAAAKSLELNKIKILCPVILDPASDTTNVMKINLAH
jgi:hypothetical protein